MVRRAAITGGRDAHTIPEALAEPKRTTRRSSLQPKSAILNLADYVNETCPYGHTTNAVVAILRVCSGAVRRFPAILRIAEPK